MVKVPLHSTGAAFGLTALVFSSAGSHTAGYRRYFPSSRLVLAERGVDHDESRCDAALSPRTARKLLDQIAGTFDGLALPHRRRCCRARDGDLG